MRRVFIPACVAAAVCLAGLVPACGESSSKEPGGAAAVSASDVVGTWVFPPESVADAAYNLALNESTRSGTALSDAELEARAASFADTLRANPAEYTLTRDGNFTATAGRNTARGTWVLDGADLILSSAETERPRRFRVGTDELISLPSTARGREVRMVRK